MKRYLNDLIYKDLQKKMVFLTGPRQVGKTYLARDIQTTFRKSVYLNNDNIPDAKIIREQGWTEDNDLIVLDEIHKMSGWKNFLKGAFDTKEPSQTFLVTGSARLDTFRQAGDSLAGRYFQYRLNPISVKEMKSVMSPYEALSALMVLGGFPEPFLSGSIDEANRWRRQYFTDIVRDDILEFSRIHELRVMRTLLELLRSRVGSPLSYVSLAQDLQVAPNTVKNYIAILESLHIVFLIRPFHKNIARALLKEPKLYFYDSGYSSVDDGIRLENTVAVCLRKHIQYIQDTTGSDIDLCYIRTKDGREIDFVIVENGMPKQAIEVKLSDNTCSDNLVYLKERNLVQETIQLVHNLKTEHRHGETLIAHAGSWLSSLAA